MMIPVYKEAMKVKVIGLTGGSGAGKGYVSALLQAYGIPSLDTDLVSRRVCAPGQPCLAALIDRFGAGIVQPDGSLNRRQLAARVFARPEELADLNRITHRYILQSCRAWLEERRAAGCALAVIDAPLLFESGFDRECDRTVAVLAPIPQRIARIMARDGLDEAAARLRLSRQKEDAFFREHADAILLNGDSDDIRGQVEALVAKLRADAL